MCVVYITCHFVRAVYVMYENMNKYMFFCFCFVFGQDDTGNGELVTHFVKNISLAKIETQFFSIGHGCLRSCDYLVYDFRLVSEFLP